jgi:hypothetical protein
MSAAPHPRFSTQAIASDASRGEFEESLTSRVDQKVMTKIKKSENHT